MYCSNICCVVCVALYFTAQVHISIGSFQSVLLNVSPQHISVVQNGEAVAFFFFNCTSLMAVWAAWSWIVPTQTCLLHDWFTCTQTNTFITKQIPNKFVCKFVIFLSWMRIIIAFTCVGWPVFTFLYEMTRFELVNWVLAFFIVSLHLHGFDFKNF